MAAVEAAVATAQGAAGDIPADAAAAIVARVQRAGRCRDPGATDGRSARRCSGCSTRCDRGCRRTRAEFLHRGLTTQDVVDTATMMLVRDALQPPRRPRRRSGRTSMRRDHRALRQRRDASPIVPATRRRDHRRAFAPPAGWISSTASAAAPRRRPTPVQLGGLIGDRMGISDGRGRRRCHRARALHPARPWHTDRAPVIAARQRRHRPRPVGRRRSAADIAQLVQLGEITTRAGGSSAAAGKRNPIDAMRAMAAAEACLGVATVITHAKPHELERGLGSWHAEWFAVPLVFQTVRRSDGGDRRCARLTRGRAIGTGRRRRSPRRGRCLRHLSPGAITMTSFATTPNGTRIAYSIGGPAVAPVADLHPLARQRPPHVGATGAGAEGAVLHRVDRQHRPRRQRRSGRRLHRCRHGGRRARGRRCRRSWSASTTAGCRSAGSPASGSACIIPIDCSR